MVSALTSYKADKVTIDRAADNEVYMARLSSEKLRGAADEILSRRRTDRASADKDTRGRAKDFKAHVLKYRHAYEFLSQIIAYADADVSRRAMLCSVLEPNLHVTELDDAEDFLTGVTLAGVAIAQGDVEEDHSVTDGEADPLNTCLNSRFASVSRTRRCAPPSTKRLKRSTTSSPWQALTSTAMKPRR